MQHAENILLLRPAFNNKSITRYQAGYKKPPDINENIYMPFAWGVITTTLLPKQPNGNGIEALYVGSDKHTPANILAYDLKSHRVSSHFSFKMLVDIPPINQLQLDEIESNIGMGMSATEQPHERSANGVDNHSDSILNDQRLLLDHIKDCTVKARSDTDTIQMTTSVSKRHKLPEEADSRTHVNTIASNSCISSTILAQVAAKGRTHATAIMDRNVGTTDEDHYPLATSAEAEIRVLKPLSHIKNNDVNSHIQQAVEYIGGGDTHFVNTRCSMKRSRVNDECILESNYNKCIKIDEDTSQ